MAYNERSRHITQGVERSPNRAMYYALGYEKADFDKPTIGIVNRNSTVRQVKPGLQSLVRRTGRRVAPSRGSARRSEFRGSRRQRWR